MAVVDIGHDAGKADGPVVVRFVQTSRFGYWYDVGLGPLRGLVVLYQSCVAKLKYDIVELTVFQHLWRDVIWTCILALFERRFYLCQPLCG